MHVARAITADYAQLLEQLEAASLAAQVEALARCGAVPESRVLQIGPAVAAVTDVRFGRKLNHVVGLGMGTAATVSELASIEEAYANIQCPIEIDLCPFSDASTLGLLGERGYTVNAFSNTYHLYDLANVAQFTDADTINVRTMAENEVESFRDWSVAGFAAQSNPRPLELLRSLATSALHRNDTTLHVAEVNGIAAGTAAVSIIDLHKTRGAYLHLASTLEQFRGQGVQAAMLRARLRNAAEAGASFAAVTARPTTSSARNAERAGFRLAYTKPTFSRSLIRQSV